MGVMDAGHEHASREVDNTGLVAREPLDGVVAAYGENVRSGYRQRRDRAPSVVDGIHMAIDENHVSGLREKVVAGKETAKRQTCGDPTRPQPGGPRGEPGAEDKGESGVW